MTSNNSNNKFQMEAEMKIFKVEGVEVSSTPTTIMYEIEYTNKYQSYSNNNSNKRDICL